MTESFVTAAWRLMPDIWSVWLAPEMGRIRTSAHAILVVSAALLLKADLSNAQPFVPLQMSL
jgi:hypothetical protein